jgi:hypothetical protein
MVLVEEIRPPKNERALIETTTFPVFGRPLSEERIAELADIAAQNTVDGFIAQDQLEFDRAVLHWSQVFHAIFPEFDSERVMKASEAFITALFAESKLKDDNADPYTRVHDEKWEFIRNEFSKMCRLLNLPASFGIETTNAYRYHAIKDDAYVKHLIELHRVLMKRLTGTESVYRELAGLYLTAISFHDQHNRYGVLKGKEIMKAYYTILFEAKNVALRASY